MSKHETNKKEIVEETAEVTVEEILEETTNEVVKEPVIGIVTGCDKLRVRAKASTDSDIVTVVDAGSELHIIDGENASADFFKVTTEVGIDGFVMRKFVTIK